MDGWNPLPPISPEINDYLANKEVEKQDSTISVIDGVPASDDDVDFIPNSAPRQEVHQISEDLSVVGEVQRRLEDLETLLDDKLLQAADAAVAEQKLFFEHALQKVHQRIQEKLELDERKKQQEAKQEQEKARLDEIRRYKNYYIHVCHFLV